MIEKIKKRIAYLQNQIDETTHSVEQYNLKSEQRFLIKENISDDSIIGILWSSGTKEFITSCEGGFCSINIEDGIHSSKIVENSKQKLIDRFNSKNVLTLEVFTFDTEKELYKWLSE